MENTLKKKTITQKALQHVARRVIQKEVSGWPPVCTGFIFQPMRPFQKPSDTAPEEEK